MRILHVAAAATAVTLVCGAAHASDIATADNTPSVGVGMICNTPDQAKQFLDLRSQGVAADRAMKKVNDDAQNPRACGVAAIAFVRDRTVDAKPVNNKLLQVERINVVAGYDGSGWQHVPSMVQYAVVEGGGDGI